MPFGRGRRVGIVVDVAQDSELPRARLKPVVEILDPQPLLTAELLDTLRWTARYYQHPLGEVLQAALPTGLRRAREAADAGERALMLSGVTAAPPRAGSRAAQLLELLAGGPLTAARLDSRCRAGAAPRRI